MMFGSNHSILDIVDLLYWSTITRIVLLLQTQLQNNFKARMNVSRQVKLIVKCVKVA